MPSVDRLSDSLALSREADRMISDLHAAIRCLCCPVDGMFRRLTEEPPSEAEPFRTLRRSDFVGLLDRDQIDAEMGDGL